MFARCDEERGREEIRKKVVISGDDRPTGSCLRVGDEDVLLTMLDVDFSFE